MNRKFTDEILFWNADNLDKKLDEYCQTPLAKSKSQQTPGEEQQGGI